MKILGLFGLILISSAEQELDMKCKVHSCGGKLCILELFKKGSVGMYRVAQVG